MALTKTQLDEARAFINSQWGGGSGAVAPDGGWQFNGDFTGMLPGATAGNVNGLDSTMIRNILGAGQAMGYGASDLASILGVSYEDVAGMQNLYGGSEAAQDNISRLGRNFINDFGVGDSSLVQDQYLTVRNPDGSYSSTERGANTGTGLRGDGMGRSNTQGGNPYLQQLAGQMGDQWTQTLTEQWLPSIRDNSIAAGGLGGSRAGVAQAGAIGKAAQGYASGLAGLYGQAWESDQNRGLSRYGMDLNYDTQNRALDYQGIGLGAQLMGMGNQQPWYGYGQMGSLLGGASGNNNTGTQTTNQGGGWGGLLGGALAGGALGRQAGWWGS